MEGGKVWGGIISLVEVGDVDVCTYVLVMTTVIYNSPRDLSCIVFCCADWNQYLGQSFHLEHICSTFLYKYSVHAPSEYLLPTHISTAASAFLISIPPSPPKCTSQNYVTYLFS